MPTNFTGIKSLDDSEVTYVDEEEEQEANLRPFASHSTSSSSSATPTTTTTNTTATNITNNNTNTTATMPTIDLLLKNKNNKKKKHVGKNRNNSSSHKLMDERKLMNDYANEYMSSEEGGDGTANDSEYDLNEEDIDLDSSYHGTLVDRFTTPLKLVQIGYLVMIVTSIILSVCLIAVGFAFYMILVDGLFRLIACIVGLGASILFLLRISDYDKKQMRNAFRLLIASCVMLVLEFGALMGILIYVKVKQVKTDLQGAMWSASLFINLSTIPLVAIGAGYCWLMKRRL